MDHLGKHAPNNTDLRMDIGLLEIGDNLYHNGSLLDISKGRPFFSQLQGAFLALLARESSCSGVRLYSWEYLQIPAWFNRRWSVLGNFETIVNLTPLEHVIK